MRLIQRMGGGDPNATIAAVVGENRDYRERHRQDQEVIGQLQARLPEPGSIVVPPDKAAAYRAFEATGLTAEQLAAALKERDELRANVATMNRLSVLDAAAADLGWKAPVLRALMKSDEYDVTSKEVTRPDPNDNTKTVTVREAQVRPAGDEAAEWKPLAGYVEQHLADFLPALIVSTTANPGGGNGGGGNNNGNNNNGNNNGVRFPQQPTGGKATKGDVVAQAIERAETERARVGNPLFPKAPA